MRFICPLLLHNLLLIRYIDNYNISTVMQTKVLSNIFNHLVIFNPTGRVNDSWMSLNMLYLNEISQIQIFQVDICPQNACLTEKLKRLVIIEPQEQTY
ncbi:hypothetical protein X801_04249 [Opisthorchis viverrini]|uniref:Uncharacterized protein n=1 Tax=Opisthorchis viverrini TaxID=6198 RepID=A0A1S8WZN4_OPIVI|nr:hypothetical protein X801_04249 [Opisthorchis viverrini]